MQIKGDNNQSEKEKISFLTLCFIQVQDWTWVMKRIFCASTFCLIKNSLDCSKWLIRTLWFTKLIPSQLLHNFQTTFDTIHVIRLCEVVSSSLPHRAHNVSLKITPILNRFCLVAILFEKIPPNKGVVTFKLHNTKNDLDIPPASWLTNFVYADFTEKL